MQATVVKALLDVTATIPVTLLVFNDPEESSHSNVIIEVEDGKPFPMPNQYKPVTSEDRFVLREAKTEQNLRKPLKLQKRESLLKSAKVTEKRDSLDGEAKAKLGEMKRDIMECASSGLSTSSFPKKSLLRPESLRVDKASSVPVTSVRKRGSLLKPKIVPEKSILPGCEKEILVIEPDIVESTSGRLPIASQENKSLLRNGTLSQQKSSLDPKNTKRKGGSLLKPVIVMVPEKERNPLGSGSEPVIVEVEPDKVECKSSRLSTSTLKNKSLLKPEILSLDKSHVNPVTTTKKGGSLLKPVILPEKSHLLDLEPEMVEVEPDIAQFTSTGLLIPSQKNKSLLKPEILSLDKSHVNPVTTTKKRGTLLKPVILPEKSNLLESDPGILEVEPDIVQSTSTKLSISSSKKSLLRPENVSKDKPTLNSVTTTRKKGSLLKPVSQLPEKRDLVDCARQALTKEPDEVVSLSKKLVDFKKASRNIVTTIRPAKSLLKPAVASNPGSLSFPIKSGLYKRSSFKKRLRCGILPRKQKELMEMTRSVDRRDQGDGCLTQTGGGVIDVELPTIEWQRSELNNDKKIFVIRKTGRYRSSLKKKNQATKKILSTTTSVPAMESCTVQGESGRHAQMDYHHIGESGTTVFDCTSADFSREKQMKTATRVIPSENEMETAMHVISCGKQMKTVARRKRKRTKTATPGEADVSAEEIARAQRAESLTVLKDKLKKTKERLHSRHRRVSSSVCEVAALKNLVADLKSRDLIAEAAVARLNEAIDYSLSVYKNNNFCDDLATDS